MATEMDTPAGGEMVYDDINISELSDDDLYQRLIELGVFVGPIVDTTRSIYQRKLFTILSSPNREKEAMSRLSGVEENNDMEPRQRAVHQHEYNRSHSEESNGSAKQTSSDQTKKKSNTVFATVFEIFLVSFLLIVGYIFYQEVQSYSAAEREYSESQAQNFQN